MPSLNFKRQFADAVASGQKRQTIRARGKRAWKVGDTAHLFTDMRMGTCRRLGTETITSVQLITIQPVQRRIDLEKTSPHGVRYLAPLLNDEALALAQADGFATLDDFFEFFQENYGRGFSGYLIKW